MKKFLFYGLLLVLLSLGFSWMAYAEDQEYTVPFGKLKVVFEPSPDERVTGHIIYFYEKSNPELEYYVLIPDKTVTEHIFNAEIEQSKAELYPGRTYVFTATAYDGNAKDQSIRSNSATVHIQAPGIPEQNFLPEPYVFVLSPQGITISEPDQP